MQWLQTLDSSLFHWVNSTLANPVFDTVMPVASTTPHFGLAVFLICAVVACKGGARGRLCVLMCLLAVALGDTFVCNTIKQAVARPRPFLGLAEVHIPFGVGKSGSGSMPSSHAANWFAATMVVYIYYRRRSLWFMLPLALTVSFSRIYNGVHYPSDVLAGAILGAGYAAAGVWTLDALWQSAGRRWFPLWWQKMPSLIEPEARIPAAQAIPADSARMDQHWLRLGYLLIFLQLAIGLAYIASGKIDLSEDEAYQWIWSKHLALSYYSKPPLIAYSRFLSTHLWGDTAFGIRFFAPIITAGISLALMRFLAREVNARTAFWLSVILAAVPVIGVGSILMTVDSLSVMFWTLAMMAGWRAAQDGSTTRNWLWVGLWMGLGFLSKYTALFQVLCWAVFFALWPPARKQLRRPSPYLALGINLACMIPVIAWNYQHGWITVHHVAQGGSLDQHWAFTLSNLWRGFSRYTLDFFEEEAGLLNPFFFVAAIWAAFAFWRRKQDKQPLMVYFFSMGAPLFLSYLLLTVRSRVLPNWIAPAVTPLLCLMAVYWDGRWQAGVRAVKCWLIAGVAMGLVAVVVLHDINLIGKISGWNLPPKKNPLRRVQGWRETTAAVETARQKLLAEGKPVFIIGGHYGITSQITFYLPEAKAGVPDHPLAYFQTTQTPENQFYFWPGYQDRKGQNAIYARELELLGGKPAPPPEELTNEFESVTDLGAVEIIFHGKLWRRIQICECRGLR